MNFSAYYSVLFVELNQNPNLKLKKNLSTMHITSLHKTMIMLFLLIFISQATASSLMVYKMVGNMTTMSQSMSNSINSTMTNMKHDAMGNMNHSEMSSLSINTGDNNDDSQASCCQSKCNCFVNGCAFNALITDFYFSHPLVASTTKFYSPLLVNYSQHSKSLYRPPILS